MDSQGGNVTPQSPPPNKNNSLTALKREKTPGWAGGGGAAQHRVSQSEYRQCEHHSLWASKKGKDMRLQMKKGILLSSRLERRGLARCSQPCTAQTLRVVGRTRKTCSGSCQVVHRCGLTYTQPALAACFSFHCSHRRSPTCIINLNNCSELAGPGSIPGIRLVPLNPTRNHP